MTSEVLDIKGRQLVSLTVRGREFHHEFLVCNLPTETAGILGTDFFVEYGATMDLQSNKLSIYDVDLKSCVGNETHVECTALTVFAEGKEGHSPQPNSWKVKRKDVQFQADLSQEKDSTQVRSWLVRSREKITLEPRCREVITAKLEFEKEQTPSLGLHRTSKGSDRRNFPCTRINTGRNEQLRVTSKHVTSFPRRKQTLQRLRVYFVYKFLWRD